MVYKIFTNFKFQKLIFGTMLTAFLSETPFLNIAESIVSASINVYSTICNELLPTPDKSHYTFNLRDLGKVFQGVMMADPSKIKVCTQNFDS